MEILRNISIFWSLAHTLIMFLFLFESRYPRRKNLQITLVTMIPLILVNFVIAMLIEPEQMGTLLLITLSLPSLIVFWILAKHRDGRFFFTFCLVDTTVMEIIYITQIINHYLTPDTYLFLFIARLVILPLIDIGVYKKLRPIFLDLQKNIPSGWYIFALIGAIFYILMTLAMNFPTAIVERPQYLPAMGLIFLLVPIIYSHIIITLHKLCQMHMSAVQEDLLSLQVNHVTARMEELASADERFREERHNYRHKMKTIASLVENKQYDELSALVSEYTETFKKTQVIRYAKNPIIDAVLSTYIKTAESKHIKVTVGLAFPDEIPVRETELSTVLANAIENAIHACEKLPPDKRHISVKVLNHPRFMIRISNSFDGRVEFNEDGLPVTHEEGHGFGTRSIAAFCEKYGAYYIFKANEDTFTLYLNF